MRIALFATNASFTHSIYEELEKYHTVEVYRHIKDSDWYNIQNVRKLLEWCDVAFFDHCHFPLPAASFLQLVDCKVVVRIHGQDFYVDRDKINWNFVDLIIATEAMKRKIIKAVPDDFPTPITTLPIGVDLESFSIPVNKTYGKKVCTQATNIYWKKRVYTTIQTFYELLKRDPSWELYIKGSENSSWLGIMQQRYMANVKELVAELGIENKVHFSPQSKKEDWANWLHDMDVYVSNSIEEGFHVSLAEAMASGVYPVINRWLGATDYYPIQYICNTQTEIVEKILDWNAICETEKRMISQNARTAVEQYDDKLVRQTIRQILEEMK